MIPILILISVAAFACSSFATRLFQTRFPNAAARLPLFQALYCLVSTLCFWGAGSFRLPTAETALYGFFFGLLFCLAVAMSARCYVLGSMALTSVIVNMSLILPILYSILLLSEPLTVLHVVGFLLFCGSVLFSALSGGKDNKKGSLIWLLLVLIGFAANGSTAILQKSYVLYSEAKQDSVFLAVAYLTASIAFMVMYLVKRIPKSARGTAEVACNTAAPPLLVKNSRVLTVVLFIAISCLAGVGSFGGNLLLGRLTSEVLAAILYPCINGGLAVLTTLLSFFFFKEKVTLQKICSVLLGAAAIVVLNL